MVPKPSDPFLHHWVADGTYLPSFFMFLGMPPWTVSIPTWPCRTSWGSQAPGNPQVSLFNFLLGFLNDFLTFEGWARLLLSFVLWGPKLACSWAWVPSYGLLMDLGLPFFFFFNYWKPECFLDFNHLYCFGLWYNIVIFWTSTTSYILNLS